MTENSNYNSENLNLVGEENNFSPAEEVKTEEKKSFRVYIPYGFTPEEYKEYTEIKRASKIIGTAFLAMTGIIIVLSVILSVVSGFSLGLKGEIASLLQNPAFNQAEQIVFSLTAFIFTFAVVFKLYGVSISNTVKLSRPKKGLFLPFFLFGVAFCAFANIATSMAAEIFESFGIDYSVSYGENPDGFFGFLLTLISTVIVPALAEEFACRGLILGILRKFGEAFAVTVSAILFGLMHGNFEQMPFAFLVGLVLGFVTVKSGSLWTAVAIHAFNNFISVVFDYLSGTVSQSAQNVMYIVFLCVSMLLGFVGILLLKENKTEIYEFNSENSMQCAEKTKYKWFFRSALIIICAVINFAEAFTFFIF